ncbi:MAG: hypothetical protein WCJ72_18525, partial [Chryseobacterium sp.]
IKQSMPKIRQKFIASLKKTIRPDYTLDLAELNQQLDAQKESIYKDMRAEFLKQCAAQNLPKADYDSLKEALHKTTAFQNLTILEITPYSANLIQTPTKSSHDFSPEKDADERVSHYDGQGKHQYTVIRSPIPIPPKKYYESLSVEKTEIKEMQIRDTCTRIERISKANEFDPKKPIYECLLTSYHTGLKLWDGNEQTERANLLPAIQDRMNDARILKGENLYLPFLAPTNGFGEEITTSTGFRGFFRNLEIEELAWRNNMALAIQLGTGPQKDSILEAYRDYLTTPADPEKKEELRRRIEGVQESMSYVANEPKEKTLLKIMFKHNLHEKKEFARTTATLFCANADNQVIVGCKSGNERTAMILHRLETLYDGPKGGAIEKFTCNNRGKQNTAPQAFYKNCLDHKGAAEERLIGFTKVLEEQVNETNLYGTANHISSKDTGFDHKIASNSGYNLSTNAADSNRMTQLATENNEKLQSHKDQKPLEDLAIPKPGLLARVWEYLTGLFSNSDSTSTAPNLEQNGRMPATDNGGDNARILLALGEAKDHEAPAPPAVPEAPAATPAPAPKPENIETKDSHFHP